jgi:hypothetical protein
MIHELEKVIVSMKLKVPEILATELGSALIIRLDARLRLMVAYQRNLRKLIGQNILFSFPEVIFAVRVWKEQSFSKILILRCISNRSRKHNGIRLPECHNLSKHHVMRLRLHNSLLPNKKYTSKVRKQT